MAGKTITALAGDTVHFSLYGMAPWFTVKMEVGEGDHIILTVLDKHGTEITRVIR